MKQEKVKFIDDMGKSFTGTIVKVNPDKTCDIRVKRRMGLESQVFMRVPKEIQSQKTKSKPRYIQPSISNKK